MLLPVWSLQDRDRIGLGHARRGRGRVRPRRGLSPRATPVRARAAAPRARTVGLQRATNLVGRRTASSDSRRGALFQGIRAAETATGSIARCQTTAEAAVPLDGAHGPAHGERERVLQPQRSGRIYYLNCTDSRRAFLSTASRSIARQGASRTTRRVQGPPSNTCSRTRRSSRTESRSPGTRSGESHCGASIRRSGTWSDVDGLYPSDTWSGKTVTYVRRRCVSGAPYRRALE